MAKRSKQKTGVQLIADERNRQMEKEGWTPEHDDQHTDRSLAMAAACYAAPERILIRRIEKKRNGCGVPTGLYRNRLCDPWPWSPDWDKREIHDVKRQLVIAGALIAAEIDRLQRAAANGRNKDAVG